MKPKTIVTVLLLGFVAAAAVFLVLKETRSAAIGEPAASTGTATAVATAASARQPNAVPRKLAVYYVHGTKRCNTCRAIESQARQALDDGFPEALMSGRLEWQSVNADEPANEHFYKDFELTGSSLLMVDFAGGRQTRFRNLERIWDLAADPPAFIAYVQSEVKPWLEAP